MENSLIGVITASVVCGVLFCITLGIVCYLCYRCWRHEDEKSSQHDPLINGHIPNGFIPTVSQHVPLPPPTSSRRLYQFPTMPARHMANYRPRYIEEINPQGMTNTQGHSVIGKSHTYNGPYMTPEGPVFYDVRQHGGYRSHRSPVWAQKSQEESVATMTLGEESPKVSEKQFVLESNNNRTSVKSESEHITVETRSSRTENLHIPSPDASRRSYLFNIETEVEPPSQPSPESTNEKTPDLYTTVEEPANDVLREVRRVSTRRQRRGEDGALNGGVVPPKSRNKSYRQREDPTPQDHDGAVYIFSATPQTILEHNQGQSNRQPHHQPQQQLQQQPEQQPEQPVERYFINDDMYTVSAKSAKESPVQDDTSAALRVIGRPADDMKHVTDVHTSSASHLPLGNYVQGDTVRPLAAELDNLGRRDVIEPHHIDYRVIKSKRRPSWLQNAGQWFFKGKKNK